MTGAPEFVAYRFLSEAENAMQLRPGKRDRPWLDGGHPRARECPPLRVANAIGWELVAPYSVAATWKGGDSYPIVSVKGPGSAKVELMTRPHGVFMLMLPWIFRTSPGWSVCVRGAPNSPARSAVVPLEGVIESDWLDRASYTTAQWKFTRSGEVILFQAGSPLGFVTLVPHAALADVQPEVRWAADDPEILEALRSGRASGEGARQIAVQQGYARGIRSLDGQKTSTPHKPGLQVCPFAKQALPAEVSRLSEFHQATVDRLLE